MNPTTKLDRPPEEGSGTLPSPTRYGVRWQCEATTPLSDGTMRFERPQAPVTRALPPSPN